MISSVLHSGLRVGKRVAVAVVVASVCRVAVGELPGLVPLPAGIVAQEGSFVLGRDAAIAAAGDAKAVGEFCAGQLRPATGFAVPVGASGNIAMELDPALSRLTDEGYTLAVSTGGVRIRSASPRGLFYGFQTFRQLLPAEIYASKPPAAPVAWRAPCCTVEDRPRFAWRAMMLDCSRTFQDVDYVRRYIDWLSIHKINIFHWHLTDDDGWRFESKRYPELTRKGAYFGEGTPMGLNSRRVKWFPKEDRDGGFYTQEQMREIVAYAAQRNVRILPEIDLPGHSRAAAVAYPEILCRGTNESVSVQGVAGNVWCASREENYAMMEGLLAEVASVFPFEYIHIGGDEVNHGQWSHCASCNALAKSLGLGGGGELQGHLTRRLEAVCRKLGRKLVGWNEIMGRGISRDTCIMSWIDVGPGYHAAELGHPVVMSPGPYLYFDMAQAGGERGHWWAGVVSMERTYSLDPLQNVSLTTEQLANIQGVEACLWTEFGRSHEGVQKQMGLTDLELIRAGTGDHPAPPGFIEYQTYPRLCALAEVAWTPQARRRLDDFAGRLGDHYRRLAALGIRYRVPPPFATIAKGVVTVVPPYAQAEVRYTLDADVKPEGWQQWTRYEKPFECKESGKLRMVTVGANGVRTSVEARGAARPPAAAWKPGDFASGTARFSLDPEALQRPGNWLVELAPGNGSSVLKVRSVALLGRDGEVARDSHECVLGGRNRGDDRFFRIQVRNLRPGDALTLVVTGETTGGQDSAGVVNFSRSPYEEPADATFETPVRLSAQAPAAQAVDWLRHTVCRTAGPVKKGDLFTWRFANPVPPCRVEIRTGKPNGTEEILVGATLEWSADGTAFQKLAAFEYGSAKGLVEKPFKALRITADADQSSGSVTIQDPRLEKTGLRPRASAASTLPAYGGHDAGKAADWDRTSYFWSNRPPADGDTFTWTFESPVAARSVAVMTGEPGNAARDRLAQGVVEVSRDGASFDRLGDIQSGSGGGTLDVPVKALRLRVTGEQHDWLIVQDPLLEEGE